MIFRKRFSFRRAFICWVVLLIVFISMTAPLLDGHGHLSPRSAHLAPSDTTTIGTKTNMKPSSGLQVELNTTSGSSDERANLKGTLSYRKYLANLTDNSKYDRYLKVRSTDQEWNVLTGDLLKNCNSNCSNGQEQLHREKLVIKAYGDPSHALSMI
ncbi:hypothetical protein Btru_048674 [Bulinus truncatus]|nr:hypothetical protein Btru_048674 [Bulinus truncatus]